MGEQATGPTVWCSVGVETDEVTAGLGKGNEHDAGPRVDVVELEVAAGFEHHRYLVAVVDSEVVVQSAGRSAEDRLRAGGYRAEAALPRDRAVPGQAEGDEAVARPRVDRGVAVAGAVGSAAVRDAAARRLLLLAGGRSWRLGIHTRR